MNPIECPRCSEITLVGRNDGDLIVYECENCNHEENQLGHWWQQENDDAEWIRENG